MKKSFVVLLSLMLIGVLVSCGTPSQPTQSATPTAPAASPQATGDLAAVSVNLEIANAYPALSFDRPLYFAVAGDGGTDCFVVEQTGRILVFADSPDVAEASVFLDLSDTIDRGGNEKGLLGLAFHPDYRQNGYLYVNYTNQTNTVIARYTLSANNPLEADPASEQILLTFSQPYANHNGGQLAFGPDGYLYIATGDGGSGGDPQNNAQNPSSLLGKILRIDVDQSGGGQNYGIPADNPFANNTQGYREEIYALGLRNPWRFSFDEQGTLWVADVGQSSREEIDLVELGQKLRLET